MVEAKTEAGQLPQTMDLDTHFTASKWVKLTKLL